MLFRGVAQPGSAPALGAGSPRFESGRPDHLPATSNMSLHLKTAAALGITIILTTLIVGASQDFSYKTVQNGVYTSLQADKGAGHYERHCQTCHGPNLAGANARALAGAEFLKFWMGLTLDDMFSRLQSMPPGDMPRLGAPTYIELLAYVLSANGLPTGAEPLGVDILAEAREVLPVPSTDDGSLNGGSGCFFSWRPYPPGTDKTDRSLYKDDSGKAST